jgi:hypothetical protein
MGAGGTDPWYPGPGGPWAWPGCGRVHQIVSLGGIIVWLS